MHTKTHMYNMRIFTPTQTKEQKKQITFVLLWLLWSICTHVHMQLSGILFKNLHALAYTLVYVRCVLRILWFYLNLANRCIAFMHMQHIYSHMYVSCMHYQLFSICALCSWYIIMITICYMYMCAYLCTHTHIASMRVLH